jgi:hypothetical protein
LKIRSGRFDYVIGHARRLLVHTAASDTPTSDALKLLASWAASQEQMATEQAAAKH